jgi:hypothetical protein
MNYKIILLPDSDTGLVRQVLFDVVLRDEVKSISTHDGLEINMLSLLLSDGFEHLFPMNTLLLDPLEHSYQDIVLHLNKYKVENGELTKI